MFEVDTGLIDEVEAEVGDALRFVATYQQRSYDLRYIRDDVRADYSDEEITEVLDQLEIEGMGYSHFERLFHSGPMDCAIYGFEAALMFHFPRDDFSGLFVTVDRDVQLNPEALIGICNAAIDRD